MIKILSMWLYKTISQIELKIRIFNPKSYPGVGKQTRDISFEYVIFCLENGKILDKLDALNLTEDTIIIFMSDNGGLSAIGRIGKSHSDNSPLSSGRGSLHEDGIRVPML